MSWVIESAGRQLKARKGIYLISSEILTISIIPWCTNSVKLLLEACHVALYQCNTDAKIRIWSCKARIDESSRYGSPTFVHDHVLERCGCMGELEGGEEQGEKGGCNHLELQFQWRDGMEENFAYQSAFISGDESHS